MSENYTLVLKMKSYIQPFERVLAVRELQAVGGGIATRPDVDGDCGDIYLMDSRVLPSQFASRLTYWEWLRLSDETMLTDQSRIEAAAIIGGNGLPMADIPGVLPLGAAARLPNRRVLRYGSHGAHEYRGKFFPQLVKSLLNIAEVKPGATVLDPMCGSGTTLVEARLADCRAVGCDINPLSVFVSRAKCSILSVSPSDLLAEAETLQNLLATESTTSSGWLNRLATVDREYLSVWFSEAVLRELDHLVSAIETVRNEDVRSLFWVCLSNILRGVSLQKTDDLRVRRDHGPSDTTDVRTEFSREITASVKAIMALLIERGGELSTTA